MLQLANLGVQNSWPKRTPIKPTALSANVWIDAEDYAVGTFANGAAITNKGNAAITFVVVGTTLSIQVNSDGKKEFVFDGASYIRCTSVVGDFTKYKNGTTSYTTGFIGKIGTTSNPDAAYGICGNSTFTSTTHGHFLVIDNRAASSPKGPRFNIVKGVGGSLPINSIYTDISYNTRISLYHALDMSLIMDNHRQFLNNDLSGITDRVRTSANTTSGLGAIITFSGTQPTHAFDIGTVGNGTFIFVGKMEQFMIMDNVVEFTTTHARSLDAYFQIYGTKGGTNFQNVDINQTITDDYVLGGMYDVNTSKTKTNFISSRGPDHFGLGNDRTMVQSISLNDGRLWPAYNTLFVDASTSPQGGPAGGHTPTGRLILAYGKFTSATGVYTNMIVRYSDDDGATWSSEIDVTLPVTSPVLTFWNVIDRLEVDDNGDLLLTWYGFSGTSLYNLYVMRSTDDGLSWTHNLVDTSPTAYKNESSVVNVGGGDLLYMARVETAVAGSFVFEQYLSTDNGVNWTTQGTTHFDITLYVYAHPPMLRAFLLDGTLVVACYFVNRGSRRFHVCYATAAGLVANGVSEWTGKSVYTLDIRLYGANLGWESGYPNVRHPDNDLKCEGIYSEETVNNDVCTISFFKIGDELKAKIKTELGI